MQSANYVEAWRADYYPLEGCAGLLKKYPKLGLGDDSDTDSAWTSPLSMLACLSNKQLQEIYAEYNWGRFPVSADTSEDFLRGEALEVLMGDLRELFGQRTGQIMNCTAEERHKSAITRGKTISFQEFVDLVRK